MLRSTVLPLRSRLTPMLGRPIVVASPLTSALKEKDEAPSSSSLTAPVGAARWYARRPSRGPRSLMTKATSGPKVPDMAVASAMPLTFEEMDNSTLVTLGTMGEADALAEMLKRHIMTVDKVSYEKACEEFEKIDKVNSEGLYLLKFPYQVGIAAALVAGFASFPLVFDLGTAEWFNQNYVTTDVPESEDLETVLEVGAWTWNWMEPPLGQISFFLLCLQFSRAQMDNLGVKPYTSRVKHMRAQHLADLYPQYDKNLITSYSVSKHIVS